MFRFGYPPNSPKALLAFIPPFPASSENAGDKNDSSVSNLIPAALLRPAGDHPDYYEFIISNGSNFSNRGDKELRPLNLAGYAQGNGATTHSPRSPAASVDREILAIPSVQSIFDDLMCVQNPIEYLDQALVAVLSDPRQNLSLFLYNAQEALNRYNEQNKTSLVWNQESNNSDGSILLSILSDSDDLSWAEEEPEICGGVAEGVRLSSKQDQLRSEIGRLETDLILAVEEFATMAKGENSESWEAFLAKMLVEEAVGYAFSKISMIMAKSLTYGTTKLEEAAYRSIQTYLLSEDTSSDNQELTQAFAPTDTERQILDVMSGGGMKIAQTLLGKKKSTAQDTLLGKPSSASGLDEFKQAIRSLFSDYELNVVTNYIGALSDEAAHSACCQALEMITAAKLALPTIIIQELTMSYINERRDQDVATISPMGMLPTTWMPIIDLTGPSGSGSVFGYRAMSLTFKTEIMREYGKLIETLKNTPLSQISVRILFKHSDGFEIVYDGRQRAIEMRNQPTSLATVATHVRSLDNAEHSLHSASDPYAVTPSSESGSSTDHQEEESDRQQKSLEDWLHEMGSKTLSELLGN